jgi:hypothetical protein
MFLAHTGFRPLWPVIFFLPLLALGVAFLLQATHRQATPAPRRAAAARLRPRRRRILEIGVCGLACLAAARVVFADPAAEQPRACATASREEAGALADKLYQQGDYQRAGECYQAAGDLRHADAAFLKATGPRAEETGRALKAQADTAKSLFASVGEAFRRH